MTPRPLPLRRTLALTGSVLVLAAGLTACSSDDSKQDSIPMAKASSSPSSSSAAPSEDSSSSSSSPQASASTVTVTASPKETRNETSSSDDDSAADSATEPDVSWDNYGSETYFGNSQKMSDDDRDTIDSSSGQAALEEAADWLGDVAPSDGDDCTGTDTGYVTCPIGSEDFAVIDLDTTTPVAIATNSSTGFSTSTNEQMISLRDAYGATKVHRCHDPKLFPSSKIWMADVR